MQWRVTDTIKVSSLIPRWSLRQIKVLLFPLLSYFQTGSVSSDCSGRLSSATPYIIVNCFTVFRSAFRSGGRMVGICLHLGHRAGVLLNGDPACRGLVKLATLLGAAADAQRMSATLTPLQKDVWFVNKHGSVCSLRLHPPLWWFGLSLWIFVDLFKSVLIWVGA